MERRVFKIFPLTSTLLLFVCFFKSLLYIPSSKSQFPVVIQNIIFVVQYYVFWKLETFRNRKNILAFKIF